MNTYLEAKYHKSCRDCGCSIFVTAKTVLCLDCVRLSNQHRYDEHIVERQVVCPQCGIEVRTEKRKGSKTKPIVKDTRKCSLCRAPTLRLVRGPFEQTIICRCCDTQIGTKLIQEGQSGVLALKSRKLCFVCKTSRKSKSAQMIGEKLKIMRAYLRSHPEDPRNQKYIPSEENRLLASERMKKNNPMYQPETLEKVKQTRKEQISCGVGLPLRGRHHWLYRGNRSFSAYCRSALYRSWVLPILVRDGFKCTCCRATTSLQVHHLRPMRYILALVLKNNEVDNPNDLIKEYPEEAERLIQQVVSEHKLEDGVTLCKKCHRDVDSHYRIRNTG